jgi:hypothetical protein
MKNFFIVALVLIVQISYANAEVKVGDSIICFFKVFKGQNADSQLYNNGQIAEITEVLPDGSVKTKTHSIAFVANGKTGSDTAYGNAGAYDLVNLNEFYYEKLLSQEVPIHNDIRTGDQVQCANAGFFGPSATVKLGFTSKMAAVSFKNNPGVTMIIQLEQWGCSK